MVGRQRERSAGIITVSITISTGAVTIKASGHTISGQQNCAEVALNRNEKLLRTPLYMPGEAHSEQYPPRIMVPQLVRVRVEKMRARERIRMMLFLSKGWGPIFLRAILSPRLGAMLQSLLFCLGLAGPFEAGTADTQQMGE